MRLNPLRPAVIALLGAIAFAATAGEPRHTTREDLVGAWHLVSIDVQGPNGAEVDPFYGSKSEGLLIYDRDGWFSVQIMSAPRPVLAVPSARPVIPADHAETKVAALDTYYAYYGSWTFDPDTETVTHHATGALYPDESRATYRQKVHVSGSRMTFTRTQGAPPHQTIQTKLWERNAAPTEPAARQQDDPNRLSR